MHLLMQAELLDPLATYNRYPNGSHDNAIKNAEEDDER